MLNEPLCIASLAGDSLAAFEYAAFAHTFISVEAPEEVSRFMLLGCEYEAVKLNQCVLVDVLTVVPPSACRGTVGCRGCERQCGRVCGGRKRHQTAHLRVSIHLGSAQNGVLAYYGVYLQVAFKLYATCTPIGWQGSCFGHGPGCLQLCAFCPNWQPIRALR